MVFAVLLQLIIRVKDLVTNLFEGLSGISRILNLYLALHDYTCSWFSWYF